MAKFTINEVLENIKAKLANEFNEKNPLLISDRTMIDNLTPYLSLVGEEMEIDQFVDTYCIPGVRSIQGNMAKQKSDDWKKFHETTPPIPPTPPTPPTKEFDMEAFAKTIAETQQAAIAKALEPLASRIGIVEQEKSDKIRMEQVNAKKSELKLTPGWSVDFDNSVERAVLILPKDATADQIYDNAYEHFNKTLTSRGETYKPMEGSGGGNKPDFSAVKAVLEAERSQTI